MNSFPSGFPTPRDHCPKLTWWHLSSCLRPMGHPTAKKILHAKAPPSYALPPTPMP